MSPDERDVPAAPAATSVADRYVLESLVARGGMGSVYKALDEVLARPVAVKILHPHLSDDAGFLARFRREAVAAAGLSHPSIVSIYDTGSDQPADGGERHFIVMEHCGGGTLTDLIEREGALPPERAASIVAGICSALDFAHRSGVVHRDVKPDNVLFADDGALKVADFGIAKAAYASGDLTTTGSILGTVTYISPEQASGAEPDPRSDIYSTGVVLYQLLVGRPPFQAETDVATAMMHMKDSPVPVRALKPQVPRHLDAIVMKALAKDPADRWASAEELCRALQGQAPSSSSTIVMSRPPAGEAATASDQHTSDTRWVGPVLALIVFAALLAIFVPRLLEDDGPSGAARPEGRERTVATGGRVQIAGAVSFDPDGDGDEHSEEVGLAHDGNPATTWGSEIYESPLDVLGKRGIGLVFDLGTEAEVAAIEIATSTPGFRFEVRAGDAAPESPDDLDVVVQSGAAAEAESVRLDPVSARYWLIWITDLPGGSGTVEIGEVSFRGQA